MLSSYSPQVLSHLDHSLKEHDCATPAAHFGVEEARNLGRCRWQLWLAQVSIRHSDECVTAMNAASHRRWEAGLWCTMRLRSAVTVSMVLWLRAPIVLARTK